MMMLEHEILEAVEGVMALRPKSKAKEANTELLRALKRRRDELEFAKELEAIEGGDAGIQMIFDGRHFSQR
ncbi:hypothetical protein RJD38_21360 (plasmid) [Vibrio scophthalmi]|uniref:hypothetical protein n=1 Tax=Vibrio scophthalmi TaxID=45658 RepID=UPI00080959AF|nr:hypothetical protein [Vibrio scophthalmi]ANS88179.1 hypothetical protein VSVS12_04481 [Vibrio scophthalmi]